MLHAYTSSFPQHYRAERVRSLSCSCLSAVLLLSWDTMRDYQQGLLNRQLSMLRFGRKVIAVGKPCWLSM